MYLKLKKFIKENLEESDFDEGTVEETIKKMEDILELVFPNEYRLFIQDFGGGSIFARTILGYYKSNDTMIVVDLTLEYRNKYDLPKDFLLLEDMDGYCYVLNCIDEKIYFFNRFSKKISPSNLSFSEYYLDAFITAKEDWEDI